LLVLPLVVFLTLLLVHGLVFPPPALRELLGLWPLGLVFFFVLSD